MRGGRHPTFPVDLSVVEMLRAGGGGCRALGRLIGYLNIRRRGQRRHCNPKYLPLRNCSKMNWIGFMAAMVSLDLVSLSKPISSSSSSSFDCCCCLCCCLRCCLRRLVSNELDFNDELRVDWIGVGGVAEESIGLGAWLRPRQTSQSPHNLSNSTGEFNHFQLSSSSLLITL